MFVIYGSRYYFQQRKVKTFGQCGFCSTYGWQVSYDGSNFGHLYFIPLIPLGSRKRVLQLCSNCNQMRIVDQPASLQMAENVQQAFTKAIGLAKSGVDVLPEEGGYPEEPIDRALAGYVELLISLDARDRAEEMIGRLEADRLSYLHAISKAVNLHVQGGPQGGAETWYLKAIEEADDPNYAVAMLARYYHSVKDVAKAITGYEQVAAMNPDAAHPVLTLIDLYTERKEFDKAIENWHKVFNIHPPYKDDKNLKKLYLKCCKKAGTQPII